MRVMHGRTLVSLLFLACLAAWPRPADAQAGKSDLTGQVSDEGGAAVPACRVTIPDLATNVSVVLVTGAEGLFTVTALRPGAYRITAEAPGFRPAVREG